MASENELTEKTRQLLRSVREALLRLHKTLLDFEREAYEHARGKISNSYEFLNLVMSDPWFAWLRRLSELIVEIDELLADRERPQESTGAALIQQVRMLLTPLESGDEFQRKYFEAVQQSPEVVLAHGEFAKVLGPARLSKEFTRITYERGLSVFDGGMLSRRDEVSTPRGSGWVAAELRL